MSLSIAEIPAKHLATLKACYFDTWKGRIEAPEAELAAEIIRADFIYMLRMFWQARFDMMSAAEKRMFDFFSRELLEPEAGYRGTRRRKSLIGDVDPDLYASRMFLRLWKIYLTDASCGLMHRRRPPANPQMLDLFS